MPTDGASISCIESSLDHGPDVSPIENETWLYVGPWQGHQDFGREIMTSQLHGHIGSDGYTNDTGVYILDTWS